MANDPKTSRILQSLPVEGERIPGRVFGRVVRLVLAVGVMGAPFVGNASEMASRQDPAPLAEKWFPKPDFPLLNPSAERGEWSTVETVYAQMGELAERSERLERRQVGTSVLGTPIHALFYTSGRAGAITVQIQARVHGDEPASTEGAMELAHRLAHGELGEVPVNLIIVPILNPEGAREMKRRTGTDIDPNRDYVLHHSEAVRLIYRLMEAFDPAVVLDMHEFTPWGRLGDPDESEAYTVGSDLLSIGSNHENLPKPLRAFTEEVFVGGIGRSIASAGLRFGHYELLDLHEGALRVRESAQTFVSAKNALALAGRISVLTEGRGIGLGPQHFHRRTLAQYLSARAVVDAAIAHEAAIKALLRTTRAEIAAGMPQWVLATEPLKRPSSYDLISVGTNEMETVPGIFWDRSGGQPTAVLDVPEAYFIPAGEEALLGHLRRFGVALTPVSPATTLKVEVLTVAAFAPSETVLYGGALRMPDGSLLREAVRRNHRVEITTREEARHFAAGGYLATTRQANALYLLTLEPESPSGFASLSHWGDALPVGFEFPLYRVR
jgi:hypothetical protein